LFNGRLAVLEMVVALINIYENDGKRQHREKK
jgi:hypothetical protein